MDKLKSKLNYYKEIGCSLNAEEVKKILDELENTQSDLYEANHRINDLLDIEKQKDKIISEMTEEFINKTLMYNDWLKDDLIKYFEERCK